MASQQKASTLGGANPIQTSKLADLAPDNPSNSQYKDFIDNSPDGQGRNICTSTSSLQINTLARPLNNDYKTDTSQERIALLKDTSQATEPPSPK